MKTFKTLFFTMFIPSLLSAVTPAGTFNFAGGLNVFNPPIEIADNESPEMCNCSPDLTGAMAKRNGSQRYIKQAISSFPVTSLYWAYASTSQFKSKVFFATSKDKILISTMELNPQWVVISSNNSPNQHYNFVTMNRKVLIAGDGLTENVRQYDILASSLTTLFAIDTATSGINPRPKYQFVSKNFYIAANVSISTSAIPLQSNTTYYPSRIVYSRLNNPSSMTAQRFIDFKTEDGEEITGLMSMRNVVHVFKPTGIGELAFSILDLPSIGGDFTFQEVITGYGCLAPRTLALAGYEYIFLAKDGVRMWDNRVRFDQTQETKIVSLKVKPIIDQLINTGLYKNAVGIWYPRKKWYVLSYEDANKFPHGKNNSILIYDTIADTWWPWCNWLADSFVVDDNQGSNGILYYGDSADGYVHKTDLDTFPDDSRKEISIDVMDSTFSWVGSTQDVINVLEGTASVKVAIGAPVSSIIGSSITNVSNIQFGEWYDKTKVNPSDKISFNAYAFNLSSITSFRLDFEMKFGQSVFDTNFTSVTITSNNFVGGDRAWTKFEIPLSSFPLNPAWTDLGIESVTFTNPYNTYGARFVLTGVYHSSVSIDDFRLVQATQNPIRMIRSTKLFDFNTPAFKSMGTVLVTREKSPDALFNMDIYNDFGKRLRTESFDAEIPKEIVVFRYVNKPGLSFLNSVDYSVTKQTQTVVTHWDCLNGAADSEKVVCGDRNNNRLIGFFRNNLSTFSGVYGQFGSGTSNFNLIHEISENNNSFLISDLVNQRTKVHDKNFNFIKQYGTLGIAATSYHQPTGVTQDESFFYVSDEGNNRLLKMDQSTFAIIVNQPIDHNTNADTSLVNDERNVYMAYNKITDQAVDIQNVWVDVRDKGDLSLVNRYQILPLNVSTGSYQIMGSIGLMGKYIFVPFANVDTNLGNTMFYIQKRLKRTGDLISEYVTDTKFLSSIGYALSYQPITKTESKNLKVEGRYVQMKFYDNAIDNYWKIYRISPLANVQELTY